jgi:hypothetical protein
VDLTSNSLGAEGGVVLRDSLEENMTVTSLDVRVNKISADVVSAIKETLLRNEESVKGKKEREKEKEKGGKGGNKTNVKAERK